MIEPVDVARRLKRPLSFVVAIPSKVAPPTSRILQGPNGQQMQQVMVSMQQVQIETSADLNDFVAKVARNEYLFVAQAPPLTIQLLEHLVDLIGYEDGGKGGE